ncbi:MAG: hypothetical protein HC926_04460 [Synechococcaceae cyanobacterium SM2_3_60]|nr:hypothetical protein [Synechococcaceae cyanobacterium SM2_3_60]
MALFSLFPLYCLIAAAALVYFPYGFVAAGRITVGLDLAAPRAMFDKLPPYAQRATWAHQNAWESFILFGAAALMACITQQDTDWVQGWLLAHLVARFLYAIFYIANIPILRSASWAVGTAATGIIMLACVGLGR